MMIDLAKAKDLDIEDSLGQFRDRFVNDSMEIYMDGNSLGKLPKKTKKCLNEAIENQWGKRLIRSWNEVWLDLPLRLAEKFGKLLNVSKEEIIIGESTSVRLYQITHALLSSSLYKKQLISDNLNFPTDLYILDGLTKSFSLEKIKIINYNQEITADLELLKNEIKATPGIYCLSLVTYKSAFLYPMKEINLWAKKYKSIIVWDLSHAVGAIEINLKETGSKIAIGCSYKYMNGGPGAPAFLFIEKKLQENLSNPIQGWFGHQNPFLFERQYIPKDGINRFAPGTPPILSLQAMEIGIDITLEANIKKIYKKSVAQSEFFISGVKEKLIPLGFKLESPEHFTNRGSHITLSHSASWQICQALIKVSSKSLKVIPDFRPPNFLRFGIAPLYTRFEDLYFVIKRLEEIVTSGGYLKFDKLKPKVT